MSEPDVHQLVDNFYRHEAGRLVSVLTSLFGLDKIELVEDAVQDALVRSLECWKLNGPPRDPAAWLYRVARNKALDAIRRRKTASRLALDVAQSQRNSETGLHRGDLPDGGVEDSLLRMILACSHDDVPPEARLSLTLKLVCGFSLDEIARALLSSTETTKKRIYRAKQLFASRKIPFEVPAGNALETRIESVQTVLYLMFNEGYSSSGSDSLVRGELCEEAIRLCKLLVEHGAGGAPTFALLALMLFQAARFDTRIDVDGCLLLMEEQDRTRWDRELISAGFSYLEQSTAGARVTRYHLEAGIAAQHCLAPNFAETDWRTILAHYDLLLKLHPSPVVELNRAIVVAQLDGPEAGLAAILAIRGMDAVKNYYLLEATLGELHRRTGNFHDAQVHFAAARENTASPAERLLIEKKLQQVTA